MKIAVLIARVLLGLIFLIFGLNGFLNFIPAQLPSGLAGQFLTALIQSHYIIFISVVYVAGGVPLLINRYVPLGLVLLGPVIVNILAFHIFLAPSQVGMAVLVALMWGVVTFYHRQYFTSLFVQKA